MRSTSLILVQFLFFLSTQAQEKSTTFNQTNTTPEWIQRGPMGESKGIQEIIFDLNDPTGKKVWVTSWGGLWYNDDISSAAAQWTLKEPKIGSNSIVQNPAKPQQLFVSNDGGGTYKSLDGGDSWSPLDITSNLSGELVISPSGDIYRYFRLQPYATKLDKFDWVSQSFVTVFNLTSYSQYNPSQTISDIDFDHEQHIYISLSDGKILKSFNQYGGPWTDIMSTAGISPSGQFTGVAISKDENDNKIIYAVNLNGTSNNNLNWIRKSSDGGANWTNLTIQNLNGLPISANSTTIDLHFSQTSFEKLLISCSSGFAVSSNGGTNWKVKSTTNKYDQEFAVSPFDNAAFVNFGSVGFSSNPFATSYPTYYDRTGDLITANVENLSFNNIYGGSSFYINQSAYSGHTTLTKSSDFFRDGNVICDQNESEINLNFEPSIFSADSIFLFNQSGHYKYSFPQPVRLNNVSYDEIENCLFYIYSSDYYANKTVIRKINHIGSESETFQDFTINKYLYAQSSIHAANDSTLYIYGQFLGNKLYKVNLSSASSLGMIHENVLPNNTYPAKILTSRNNPDTVFMQLLAGLYFSVNGGQTFSSRLTNDLAYDFTLNPTNPNQVWYTSNEKIFYSNNFLSNIPSWQEITGNLNFKGPYGLIKYREADGLVFVSCPFNGLQSTDYFSSLVQDNIEIARFPKLVGINDKIECSFYTNGPFTEINNFQLYISNINGDFSNKQLIGESNTSPIIGRIPNNLSSGNYKLQVISTNVNVSIQEAKTDFIEVCKSEDAFTSHLPQIINVNENGFLLKIQPSINTNLSYIVQPAHLKAPSLSDFIKIESSPEFPALIQGNVPLKQDSLTILMINGLLPGRDYKTYFITKPSSSECYSSFGVLDAKTASVKATYCTPNYYYGPTANNNISSVKFIDNSLNKSLYLSKYPNLLNSGEPGVYEEFIPEIEVAKAYQLKIRIGDFYTSFPSKGLLVSMDTNENGIFESNEVIFVGLVSNNNTEIPFTLNSNVKPGVKRLRIRSVEGYQFSYYMAQCYSYSYGEAEDYFMKVKNHGNHIYSNLTDSVVNNCNSMTVMIETNGTFNSGNVFTTELSDETGSFESPLLISENILTDFPIKVNVPNNQPVSGLYKLRISSNSPSSDIYPSSSFQIKPKHLIDEQVYSSPENQIVGYGIIASKASIDNLANLNYKALNSIELLPGFNTQFTGQGTFKAEIVGCDN